jgi:uridylate kinase
MALDETKKYNVKDFAYIVSELIKGGGGGGTVDSELSLVSENPVQNKVVTSALNGKQATLTAGDNIDITDNIISATGGEQFIESVDSTITVNESGQASITNPLPNSGNDGEIVTMASLDNFRQTSNRQLMRNLGHGILFSAIDLTSLTREVPSSYSVDPNQGTIADAFDDLTTTRWLSDVGTTTSTITINYSSPVSISVIQLRHGSNLRIKFVDIYAEIDGDYIKIGRQEVTKSFSKLSADFEDTIIMDKIVATQSIRLVCSNSWDTNLIGLYFIKLFSGTPTYTEKSFFGYEGDYCLLSPSVGGIPQDFRPVAYAGHSQRVNSFGTKTLQSADIDTYQRMASTATYTLPQDANLWGKALHCATQSYNTCIVKVASSRSGLINGERVSNLNYTIPRYTSVKLVYTSDSATADWEFIPSVPEMLYCGAGRKSTDARKLDDYYELDANVNLVAGGGTLTIGATNKVISSVKVGQNVNISGYLDVSVATSPTGTLTITGLPHACRSGLKYDSELSISVEGVTIPADHYWSAYVVNNTTTIRIRLLDLTGTVVDASPYMTTDAKIRIGGVYNASS